MKTVTINQQLLPAIGLGTWHIGDSEATRSREIAALSAGLDAGATVIDTAEMYGNGRSERLVGEVLNQRQRNDLYLVSKVLPENASVRQLPRSLDRSLEALNTDYLDLYLLHWRGNIPLAETVRAMEAAKKAGKIRAWGVSNFDVDDMQELLSVPDGDKVAVNEVLINLQSRGTLFDLLPWQEKHHIPTLAYSPIAQGDTLGGNLANNETLKSIAAAHHVSVFAIMLAWVIQLPDVLAIPESGTVDHAKENVAVADLVLSDEELTRINTAFPKPTHKIPLAVI
ncbi:Oxidoreductase aldo-keto reductase family [Furfurilactobacillus rossiae]|uniref:aldo/keto reductase n=1 Tax=Furfurilactobacillus rossiae TaxID=231049 RepID=UPI0015BF7FF1|nr:aldo/keto reductase [Furfurilactobacillus rossiae]MCF6165003.1 aldo/keto reductase [Furfurilactobacillus rossiae]QLE64075.1 Oxidoreductase aldo-keto reductase family [Furfurilactobacillus rossiae]